MMALCAQSLAACITAAAMTALAMPAAAQTVLSGDHIIDGDLTVDEGATGSLYVEHDSVIDGSLCLGNTCSPTTTFANDETLKMIYTQNSIVFVDTSSATSPDRDWTLRVNDPQLVSEGGIDRFSVEDDTAGTTPFTIAGGAPDNALWVASTGNVGIGTMFPSEELHLVGPSFPSIRFEQDTSGGNPSANWRMHANHNEFSLLNDRATFTIEAGAPLSALRVDNGGNIGLGSPNPTEALHLLRSNGSAAVLVENTAASPSASRGMFTMRNNGGSYFTLDNTQAGTTWFFTHENASPNRFIISDAVPDGPEMSLTADGDLTIPGQLFTAGSCAAGCDRVFDADYPLPTIPEQAAMMRARKHLPAVGPTPEDGPFNITAMTGGMLNELEKAHLYIEQLHAQNVAQEARIARLEAALAAR